ncbi:MAG: T9SS type A sorting domain-containing protein [Chitinophagaceae bacterium]
MKNIVTLTGKLYSCAAVFMLLFLSQQYGHAQASAKIKFSNSYVNITRNTLGGTVESGDILEIRTTLYVNSTYNTTGMIYYLRYVDNLPSNTAISAASTLNLITNEGVALKTYTQAPDADAGTYLATPSVGEFQVKVNMGGFPFSADPSAPADNSPTDVTGSGNLRGNVNKPKFGGGTLVSTAFRVQVTGSTGDIITLGSGHLLFKKTNVPGDPDTSINTIPYQILISANESLCSNTVGTNFADEFAGSFGSGNSLNRSTGPSFALPGYTYIPNVSLYPSVGINDGYYAVVNNSSPKSATDPNARRQPNCALPAGPIAPNDSCAGRMFGGFWFISGDHTGTMDAIGNPPPGPGATGGYMLAVNADIATTEAYKQTISGLCPDTYYEFSAWVKNICPLCGLDSSGSQTYKPGVLPNLTFVVDGVDRYSSGEIDTLGWLKKGFLFRTNSGQTSIVISIRDNAPGGGGNDWVLDDITLATCSPNLAMLPSPIAPVCYGNTVDISCDVTSYFSNYTHWEYEKSTDSGVTWVTTGVSGVGVPVLTAGQYQYNAAYPTFVGDSSVHKNVYRIRIASSAANLADPNCSFLATTTIVIKVNNCQWVLKTDITAISGQLKDNAATVRWSIADEAPGVEYAVEKSTDKINYKPVEKVAAKMQQAANYVYNDPEILTAPAYYRIKIIDKDKFKFSKTILLSPSGLSLGIKSITNPFVQTLAFDVLAPSAGMAGVLVIDNYGKTIYQRKELVSTGINPVKIYLPALSNGIYTLRIEFNNTVINKRVIKAN